MAAKKKKIPIPTERGQPAKYPFRSLVEVGDSFFFETGPERQEAVANSISSLSSMYWPTAFPGAKRKFSFRRLIEDGVYGVRVWRTK